MVNFTALLQKFREKGEKSGWTYIVVPAKIANSINSGVKTSYRVKGKLDNLSIRQVALMPMGDGDFILPVNASMRKELRKQAGAQVKVSLALDKSDFVINEDFRLCLEDEPAALKYFSSLPSSHQKYFSKWIDSAKTTETKTKRIAQSVQGLAMGMGYGEMIRYFRDKK